MKRIRSLASCGSSVAFLVFRHYDIINVCQLFFEATILYEVAQCLIFSGILPSDLCTPRCLDPTDIFSIIYGSVIMMERNF